jgi:AcrR family transcriptional regulator
VLTWFLPEAGGTNKNIGSSSTTAERKKMMCLHTNCQIYLPIFSIAYAMAVLCPDHRWWYYFVVRLQFDDRGEPLASKPNPLTSKGPAAERILKAAKTLFAGSGFANTSTMSIARMAQTSESQLIKHFGSKEGLLEAIFEDGWNHIAKAFGTLEYIPAPSSKLQALVGLILSKLEEDEQLKQLFLLEGRRIRKEGRMVLMTKGFLGLVNTADRLLKEMRDLGQLRSDLSIEGMRSALIGMLEGLLRDRMLAGRIPYSASYTAEDIRKLFLHVLHSFSDTPEYPSSHAKSL